MIDREVLEARIGELDDLIGNMEARIEGLRSDLDRQLAELHAARAIRAENARWLKISGSLGGDPPGDPG